MKEKSTMLELTLTCRKKDNKVEKCFMLEVASTN